MAAVTPATSAINPHTTAYRVLRTPIAPKYTATTYKVVSVLPCMTDESLPANESTPKVFIVSTIIPLDPLPLSGRTKAVGRESTKSVFIPDSEVRYLMPSTR